MTDGRIAGAYQQVRGLFGSWPGLGISFPRPRRDVVKPLGTLKPFTKAPRSWYRPSRSWILVPLLLLFCLIYGFAFAILAPYIVVPFAIPIILLLLLVIWAMPDAAAPAKTLNSLFFAFFIGLIAWPNYLSISLPGLPWISIIRLTVFPMTLVLLYASSVSREFREKLMRTMGSAPLLWKAVAVLACIETLSVLVSSNPFFSIGKLVVAQTEWTAIFFVSCYVFLKPGRATKWAACLWGLGIWVGAIGIWENRLGYVPWRNHIPSFFAIDPMAEAFMAGQQRSALGIHRVQSTFTTSLGLSEFLALTLPFVVHFLRKGFRWWIRAAAAVTIPVLVYVIVISQSRLGLVGSLVTTLSFILIWAIRNRRLEPRNPFWTAIVAAYPVIFGAIVASTFLVGRIHARVWGNGPQQFSDQSRVEQYHLGIPKILTHPWGYGIGMGSEALGFADNGGFGTIDSYYILIGLEYGIVGFFVYYGMIVLGLYEAGRYSLSSRPLKDESSLLIPIAVTLLNFVVIKSVFAQQDNHPIIFMVLGMLVALIWRDQNQRKLETKAATNRFAKS